MVAVSTRRWGGRTNLERSAERRALLIEAAIRVYGEQGFHQTGVRAICQVAGLTERYFYENFANGEALLAAAFETIVASVMVAMRSSDDPALPQAQRMSAMLQTYYRTLREHPGATRVFLVEIAGVSPAIDALFEESLTQLTEPMMEIYDPQRIGRLSSEPLLRRGVAGGLLHIALAWSANDFAEPLEQVSGAGFQLCQLAIPEI